MIIKCLVVEFCAGITCRVPLWANCCANRTVHNILLCSRFRLTWRPPKWIDERVASTNFASAFPRTQTDCVLLVKHSTCVLWMSFQSVCFCKKKKKIQNIVSYLFFWCFSTGHERLQPLCEENKFCSGLLTLPHERFTGDYSGKHHPPSQNNNPLPAA